MILCLDLLMVSWQYNMMLLSCNSIKMRPFLFFRRLIQCMRIISTTNWMIIQLLSQLNESAQRCPKLSALSFYIKCDWMNRAQSGEKANHQCAQCARFTSRGNWNKLSNDMSSTPPMHIARQFYCPHAHSLNTMQSLKGVVFSAPSMRFGTRRAHLLPAAFFN